MTLHSRDLSTLPTVGVSAGVLQADHQPEVRHRHHDRHRPEHDHDGSGALRSGRAVHREPQVRQPRLHQHLHHGVHLQAARPASLLLQAAVERLRLRRRRSLALR